jgi:hypothetical protein
MIYVTEVQKEIFNVYTIFIEQFLKLLYLTKN